MNGAPAMSTPRTSNVLTLISPTMEATGSERDSHLLSQGRRDLSPAHAPKCIVGEMSTPLVLGALVVAGVFLAGGPRRRRRRQARVHWLVGVALLAAAAALVHRGGWTERAQQVAADKLTVHTGGAVAKRPKTTASAGVSGAVLNDAGFARIRAGDYRGAVPLLEQAVQRLAGSGSIIDAYALFNLAHARFAVGRCDGVLSMLDRSQARQGHRAAIDHLRTLARRRC